MSVETVRRQSLHWHFPWQRPIMNGSLTNIYKHVYTQICVYTNTYKETTVETVRRLSTVEPPKNGLIALQTPRTCRLTVFKYCQVVNRQLLRLLSTHILVEYRVIANYTIKLRNILYHWQLSMASFHFCETCLLHIKPFVVNKSAIFPF